MAFPNTPGNAPGPRVFFPFLDIPPHAFGFPNPRPAAGLGGRTPGRARSGQERVKGAKMAGLFCSPRHHAEAALCLRGRGQGSAALSGTQPRPARAGLLPCAPEPLEPSRLEHGGATARPARSFGAAAGPSASPSVCGPSRGLASTLRPPHRSSPAGLPGPFPPHLQPMPCDGRGNTALHWPVWRTAHAGPSKLPWITRHQDSAF